MLTELRSIAVFAKVAETGSFRAAATKLNLSPSVVSNHVSTLEANIGKALIYRSTRRLSLTDAGETLLRHANNMIESAEAGINAVTDTVTNPSGRLSITAPADFQYGRFVEDLSLFASRYPKVGIDMNFTNRRCDIIAEGIDVAIRLDAHEDSTLKAIKIHQGERRLLATPEYLNNTPAINTPSDLSKHTIMHDAGLRRGITFTHRHSGKKEVVRERPMISLNTGYSAFRFVIASRGIACLPAFILGQMPPKKKLVEVLPEWSLPSYGIYAVWPSNSGDRSLRRLLVDFIRAEIKRRPPLVGLSSSDDKLTPGLEFDSLEI